MGRKRPLFFRPDRCPGWSGTPIPGMCSVILRSRTGWQPLASARLRLPPAITQPGLRPRYTLRIGWSRRRRRRCTGRFARRPGPAGRCVRSARRGWRRRPVRGGHRRAGAAGIAVDAWVVLAHSSRLGRDRPELAVRNCFGDSYPYALCVANEEVRDYSALLAAEAVRDVPVAGVSIESCGQLGFAHNGLHEKTVGAYPPAAERMLSVCCCAGCQRDWTAAGAGPEQVVAGLRQALGATAAGRVGAGAGIECCSAPTCRPAAGHPAGQPGSGPSPGAGGGAGCRAGGPADHAWATRSVGHRTITGGHRGARSPMSTPCSFPPGPTTRRPGTRSPTPGDWRRPGWPSAPTSPCCRPPIRGRSPITPPHWWRPARTNCTCITWGWRTTRSSMCSAGSARCRDSR